MAYQGSSDRLLVLFPFVTLLIIKRDLHAPGLQKAPDKILANCHKNSYNYCDPDVQKAVGDCVKGMASSLMVRRIFALKYKSDPNTLNEA